MSEQNNMSKHLDKNVIVFFIGVFLIAASLLAYKSYKRIPCKDVVFSINAKDYMQGELIRFVDETQGAKVWNWTFGDSTKATTLKDPMHVFKEPGEYKITLTVNNFCKKTEIITIDEKVVLLDTNKLPKFKLLQNILVGERLVVIDSTVNASTWEWRFGENESVDATTKLATYVYKTPGLKTVSLIVNGDEKHKRKKRINVFPQEEVVEKIVEIKDEPRVKIWNIPKAPKKVPKNEPAIVVKNKPTTRPAPAIVKEEPPKKEVPFISNKKMKANIILVSRGKMQASQFSEYFCGDINKPIVVNGKNTTFLSFCQKIDKKKIKIKKLYIHREESSNCIKSVAIGYTKLGIW